MEGWGRGAREGHEAATAVLDLFFQVRWLWMDHLASLGCQYKTMVVISDFNREVLLRFFFHGRLFKIW